MKQLRLALVAFALPLALAACTTPTLTEDRPAVAVGSNVVVLGTNALADAADAYAVVANTTAVVVRTGALPTPILLRIRDLNKQAGTLLGAGQTTLSAAERAAQLTSIIGQLRNLTGKR